MAPTKRERLNLRVRPEVKRQLQQRATDEQISVNHLAEAGLMLFLAALLPNKEETNTND